jgi:6-phosphogluconolactonase (cycloisomerase 2 family)
MKRLILLSSAAIALAACADTESTAPRALVPDDASATFGPGHGNAGDLYLQTNSAAGNAVLIYPRSANGALGSPTSVTTGGLGTGGGLGNQGGVVISNDGRHLYAVNAGSDEVSAFSVTPSGLQHLGNVSSGGDEPISIALHGRLLYVLNDGAVPNVSGFSVSPDGSLSPLAGSTRGLSAAVVDAAQVGISPNGDYLVVTEKATNTIVSWSIGGNGLLSSRTLTASASPTPFGFAFSNRGALLVSEAVGGAANASVLSSYEAVAGGWAAVSPSVATTETAACWVVVTPNGKFAYTTNTGSASVSGFDIGHGGSLMLLDADGVTGMSGAGPIDAATSHNGRFLYVLTSGSDVISAFSIDADGSLNHIGDTPVQDGANGLAAR